MSFIKELKRRNVFRVAAAYVVVGWLLAEVASLLFGTFEAPAWVMKVFVTVIALGFPLALFFAWAYELTPDGLKREAEIDRTESITSKTGRKLDFFIIAVLIFALAYFAYDKFVLVGSDDAALVQTTPEAAGGRATRSGQAESLNKSIAVLPFVNMSDDAGNEYFSDGISEEILNSLAKVQDLKVAGRTSSFSFKGRNADLRTIGEALGVSHILEGSVRKAGAHVRITAQLIKADDGFHLWSETYDRELTDIFAIQDEIAQAIFDQLKLHLIGEQGDIRFTSSRADVSAYDLYLEAKQRIYLRRRAPLEQAAELLERAIAIDSSYAPAYAQLGVTMMLLSESEYGTLPAAETAERAKSLFEQALSLDPGLAEAVAGLGLYFILTGDQEQAIEKLREALSINPNLVNARNWLANAHARLNQLEEVKRIREETLVRDPLYLPGISNLLDDYVLYGDISQAQTLLDRIKPFMPASWTIVSWTGVLYFSAGRVAESMPYFETAYDMEPNNAAGINFLTRALYYSGQYERLFAMGLDEFRVYGLMQIGRTEEALQLAREMAAAGDELALFRVLVSQRQYAELLEYVDSRWADLDAFEADYPERDGWSERNYLGLIAYAHQRTGNDEMFQNAMLRYEAALDYQRQMGAKNQSFVFAEALNAVMRGDHDTALSKLAAAIEGGVTFDPNLTKSWPMFEVLVGDPRFESIMTDRIGHLNSERAKLGLEPIARHQVPAQ
jgi:TolB-like protein/Flp pilus assembly protein TadD